MQEDTTQPQGDTSQPTSGQPTPPSPPSDQSGQPSPPTPPAPPAGGQPTGQQPPAGQKDLSGIMEENVDISSLVATAGDQGQQQDFISRVKVPPHPNTTFDEQKFVRLLAGSISLTIKEKERIIDAIPQLSQFQIDELMKIFDEEQQKFTELEQKHAEQMAELEKQHKGDWQDMEKRKEEEAKHEQEQQQAEDIKKSLGL